MTNSPNEIPFSSVLTDGRVRQTYTGIDELAAGIQTVGLIQPLVLMPVEVPAGPDVMDGIITKYRLVAGGRRHTALASLGCQTLYHATSSDPAKPGFIIKGEHGDLLMDLLTEISENHDREDIPWYEELPAIVRAWRMIEAQHHKRGEEITMRAFGAMLGVGYQDLRAAVAIWDAYQKQPQRFREYPSVRAALQALLRDSANEAAKLHVATITSSATLVPNTSVKVQLEPQPEGAPAIIPLSQMFLNVNSLDFMDTLPDGSFNHIVTDPDYAISIEALSANMSHAAEGVVQTSVSDSLTDLRRFLKSAFRVVDDHGFCVFWFDIEHWEKLRDYAGTCGWLVQRWPLTWRKLDYRSNASPSHNFCKNEEWAMVLRKPGACLNQAQMSSVFDIESGPTIRHFNHPFAKPVSLWKWIYNAIARKGQKVYDPFMGSGSACVAALDAGLQPLGSELNPSHYANAMLNLQLAFEKTLGRVAFT